MTYASARAQVVAIIEGTTGLDGTRDLAKSFREAKDADEDNPGQGRTFSLFGIGDDVRIPAIARARRHRMTRMELTVWYRRFSSRKELDLVLRADHRALGDRLINPTLWQRETSGIVSIEQSGGATMLHADVEQRADGLVMHVYRFDLEYLSGDGA